MSDRDDIRQPADHLPPKDERDEERDPADEPAGAHGAWPEESTLPGTAAPDGTPSVSPETAAEPDKPARHGVDRLPPSGR